MCNIMPARKEKTLKHYQYKKFFFKLFMRKSPRNAAVFGFSFICFLLSLIPALILLVLPRLIFVEFQFFIVPVVCILLLLFAYGFLILGYAYRCMVKKCFPEKISLAGLSGACAIFFTLGALVVAPCHIKNKNWLPAFLAVAGGILLNVSLLNTKGWISVNPYLSCVLLWIGLVLFIMSLISFRDGHRFRIVSLSPFVAMVLYVAGLYSYDMMLNHRIIKERTELSTALGHPADLDSFWKAQRQGFPLNNEPLRSLLKYHPKQCWYESGPDVTAADYALHLAEFKKENPEFIGALEAFLKLEPQMIEHSQTTLLAAVELNELNVFRTAARYLSCELIVNSKDRNEVLRRNAELECIRDWALSDAFLISKMVGIAIETIRLNALSYPLSEGTFNEEDFKNLMQENIDWKRVMRDALGDEAAAFQSAVNYLFMTRNTEDFSVMQEYAVRLVPLECAIWFKRDYLYALGYYKKLNLFLDKTDMTVNDRRAATEMDVKEMKKEFFLLSGMLLPSSNAIYRWETEIRDQEMLISIALAIEEYRKKYGAFPKNLSMLVPEFLPSIPCDSMNGLPVSYEYGTLDFVNCKKQTIRFNGYRLYCIQPGAKEKSPQKSRAMFTVVTPKE